jgi:hypothetical protein
MFFIKIIPLLIYTMIIKSKSKGLGNPHSYSIAGISLLLLIHCFQLVILITLFSGFDSRQERIMGLYMFLLIVWAIFSLFLSKIYNQKRLRRWYAEYKDRRFMKYSKPIVFTYYIINSMVFFLPVIFKS